jgi:SAM-dependent methyltransferase
MTIVEQQRRFYEDLFRKHGDSPRALSYRDSETQYERFERLARLFEQERERISVHEVGCGLGHFGDFLRDRYPHVAYSGCDISEAFVDHCRRRFPEAKFHLHDITERLPEERYDFVTLSGAFNPRLQTPPEEWQAFIHAMLRAMYSLATKGVGANFLTTYHDPDHTDSTLHYQDPASLTDFVVRRLSRHYLIDAGGPLYEYTLLVYRPRYVKALYPGAAFSRYFHGGRE